MFDKLEFSDVNRYFVSVGTIFIGIAFILPYFYLKETFGIIITEKYFQSLTDISKTILLNKQQNIIFFHRFLLFVSLFFFSVGLIFFTVGINRWIKRQKKIDRKFDKELEKLEIEITQMTPLEREEKILEEIKEINKENPNESKRNILKTYITVENSIIQQFLKFQDSYNILPNVKIMNKSFDLILQSKSKKNSDKIIEIKYMSENVLYKFIKDVISDFDYILAYYKSNINKSSVGILFLVYDDAKITEDTVIKVKENISENLELNLINYINIEFVKLSEVNKLKIISNIT